ncbi:hypothetical protein BLNAU_8453 [Blattamonas nauphoetae]|uniref:Secreted protein n=1 Tax=Blattamonas nauphoetae TaxID=2049346 RepID=A0ABQ9XYP8_9EUKA|nr:hypothetical protein BLNAU_8453 [Blattamonas nauphoetae]
MNTITLLAVPLAVRTVMSLPSHQTSNAYVLVIVHRRNYLLNVRVSRRDIDTPHRSINRSLAVPTDVWPRMAEHSVLLEELAAKGKDEGWLEQRDNGNDET